MLKKKIKKKRKVFKSLINENLSLNLSGHYERVQYDSKTKTLDVCQLVRIDAPCETT